MLTLWEVFCYNATDLHLFSRAGGHSNSWLLPLPIFIPHCTLKSWKVGWEIESNYLKTVIWVSHLVQRKYQRLLELSFEYVVHVHVSWMLWYLNNARIVYCLPPSSFSLSCTSFTHPPLFLCLVYFVFSVTEIEINMHLTIYGPLLKIYDYPTYWTSSRFGMKTWILAHAKRWKWTYTSGSYIPFWVVGLFSVLYFHVKDAVCKKKKKKKNVFVQLLYLCSCMVYYVNT